MNWFQKLSIGVAKLLGGHERIAIVTVVGLAALFFFFKSLRAWRDILRLDSEQFRTAREGMLRPLTEKLRPQSDIAVRDLRLQLIRAGMRQENNVERYTALRVTSLCTGAGIAFLSLVLGFSGLNLFVFASASLFCGYAFPDFSIRKRTEARQEKIARALPSVVDLMVLCLDVGLSLEAAFERVTSEITDLEPLMAEEASQMLSEMSSGITFPNALKRMAERIGLEELLTLSRLISQASVMGASIARALREYSDQAFQKRMIALEEQAGKIVSLMVLPVTLCMLPAAMIALLGPSVLMVVKMIAAS